MSEIDDLAWDCLEDLDGDYGSRAAACRDCESTDVYWAQVKDQWVLFGTNSRKHVCKPAVLNARRRDAFDNLD